MTNNYKKQLEEILNIAVNKDASDIHLTAGRPPILRISGHLTALPETPALTAQDTEAIAFSLLSEERKEQFISQRDIDLSFGYKDEARFRINIYRQLGQVSVALRHIPTKIRTIEELNLPQICH